MAIHHERVNLHLDIDNFTGRMHLVAQAAHDLGVRLALMSATWEPHDWGTF